jgi:hypothetical protein
MSMLFNQISQQWPERLASGAKFPVDPRELLVGQTDRYARTGRGAGFAIIANASSYATSNACLPPDPVRHA